MSAITALYVLIAKTISRQDAIVAALERKGVLSQSDVDAEMGNSEFDEARLREQFLDYMK